MLQRFLSSSRSFLLRAAVAIFALVSSTYLPFLLLGLLNRPSGIIKSTFICYAGNANYAQHYSFKFMRSWLRWRPTPIGVFRQGKKWGIVFATPMTEEDFLNPKNRDHFLRLLDRLENINALLGVRLTSYAGVIPSHLHANGYKSDVSDHFSKPLPVINKSIEIIISKEFPDNPDVPIILLGGNGKIGTPLKYHWRDSSTDIYVVDPNGGNASLPRELYGKPTILVDVSRRGVIRKYIDEMWENIVILNETFPEPSKSTISLINSKGVPIYHLSGVKGVVIPSLPHGYVDSVPCCAIHDSNEDTLPVLTILGSKRVV